MPDTAPLAGKLTADVPAVGAAVAQDTVIGEAPYAATVAGATFTPEAALTGVTADKRTFTIVNKGQSGAGTTVVATLDTTTGVNFTAYDEKDFTLSVVAGATTLVAGDVLELHEVIAGSGTAHSGGRITVDLTRA